MNYSKADWMKEAIDGLTSGRKRRVIYISKEQNKTYRLSCYVCNKRNEALFEVSMYTDKIYDGEPFWFGSSCAKKLKALTGIDLKKETVS